MPEGYTHVKIAKAALRLNKCHILDKLAFTAGANGPDTFFSYRIWSKKRVIDLPEIGSMMHNERCGAFLTELCLAAKTDTEKAYAMGFASHYAADIILHPYVACLTQEGMPYDMPSGHGYFEIALDSFLYQRDFMRRAIPVKLTCSKLCTVRLAQISYMLRSCLNSVYGITAPPDAVADSFHHFFFCRKLFKSRFGIKKALGYIIERLFFHKKGFITCHMQPARLKDNLPDKWRNPYTGETVTGGIEKLISSAVKLSAVLISAQNSYWSGKITAEELSALIGNKSYITGLDITDEEEPSGCNL